MASFEVQVDINDYAIAKLPVGQDPAAKAVADEAAFNLLLVPFWDGTGFIEGWDTSNDAQKVAWMGVNRVRAERLDKYFSEIKYDKKGRVLTSPDESYADSTIQWKSTDIYTTTGGGTVDTYDILVDNDVYFIGGTFIHDNTAGLGFGVDTAKVQIIDIDDVLGLGANTVLGEHIINHRVIAGDTKEYHGHGSTFIKSGLYIRIVYTSDAGSPAHKLFAELKWRVPNA